MKGTHIISPHSPDSTSARESYWDIAKALLMFLVILGHIVQLYMYPANEGFWEDPLFKGIYVFHMPLFALISGYFSAKSYAKHQIRVIPRYLQRLFLPCLGMGLLICGATFIENSLNGTQVVKAFGSLWFLTVLLECIFCYILLRWRDNWWYRLIIFILPICLAQLLGQVCFFKHLWPFPGRFCYLWPFYVAGTILAELGFHHKMINRKWSVSIPLYILFYYGFQNEWYVYRLPLMDTLQEWGIALYRVAAGFAGCALFLFLTKLLNNNGKLSFLSGIGRATLALYVLQSPVFRFSSVYHIFTDNYCLAIIESLILMYVLYGAYLVIRRIPLVAPLFLGESSRHHKRLSSPQTDTF